MSEAEIETVETQTSKATRVTVRALGKYLCGDREAICTIASVPGVLGLGFLFVVSAALAREYDGKDLLVEPWHLALPLAASLGTSFILFCLIAAVAESHGVKCLSFGTYLRFLGLYWMTAPLAWLYAIPVERFMTPLGATKSNLALLGLVSLWRVGLMIRVVSVFFGITVTAAASLVLLFADIVVLATIVMTPIPIFIIMGGIRPTPSESLVRGIMLNFGFGGLLTLPVWLIAAFLVATSRKQTWSLAGVAQPPRSVGKIAWCLGASAIAVWSVILPMTQPEQQLARRIEADYTAGNFHDAIAEICRHQRSELPPHWDPPPHDLRGPTKIVEAMQTVMELPTPDWARDSFVRKFGESLDDWIQYNPDWLDQSDFDRLVNVLLQLPESPRILATRDGWFRAAAERAERSPPVCKEQFELLKQRCKAEMP
jgi:hypothetical protein